MIDTDKYEGHAEGDWNWTKLGTMSGILLDKHGKDIVHLMMPYDLYSNPTDATAQLIADAPLLLEEVKQAREIVPKLSRFIGEMIPWIADEPEGNGIFVGEAVEWDYDDSGEWVLVNYNETRWVTMSYIESVWNGESEE
tara:strand:+ start:66 stop:482 length:417 start_codon:yes stop_codon:yes gene_type:complete